MIWAAVVLVAILIALDKSFLPGAAMFGIGMLANVIPAKEASGTTLAMLIVADWIAIWAYRKDVDWHTLRRLLPNVVGGVVLGAVFLFLASDAVTKRLIGVILLVFILANLANMLRKHLRDRRRDAVVVASVAAIAGVPAGQPGSPLPAGEVLPPRAADDGVGAAGLESEAARERVAPAGRGGLVKRIGYGSLAGFTTMVANAGGPVTSLYFMSEGFPVMRFLGTTAWFYLIVNLVKLPFSAGLGMIHPEMLVKIAAMVPLIVATVFFGRRMARRINRGVFNTLVVVLTLVTAVQLLL